VLFIGTQFGNHYTTVRLGYKMYIYYLFQFVVEHIMLSGDGRRRASRAVGGVFDARLVPLEFSHC
jgi:hypothetical protein